MCNENRNTLLNIDFTNVNDVNNWTTNASNVIDYDDGKLRLIGDDDNTFFERSLGQLNEDRNSVCLLLNFEIFRPISSNQISTEAIIELSLDNQVIQTATVCVDEIETTKRVSFSLDRTYSIEGSGALKIRIKYQNGAQNVIELKSIKFDEFDFCDDNVRFYFVFDGFIEEARTALSGLAKVTSYRVNNVETLTNEFFQENMNAVIDDANEWLFADADIDGSNRVQDDESPKTFNPFENSNGLDFDTVNSFHGGKPTGTKSGSDYGQGILNLGFLKPQVLNENLDPKNGAFFVDIDATKNLEISFDVLISDTKSVFVNPRLYRRYFIKWNVSTCTGEFYYIDVLDNNTVIDEIHNGFLYGITDEESIEDDMISCQDGINFSGNSGVFETVIDFGLETGQAGIDYQAFTAPDKFTIIWNNQEFTTGFVGSNINDQALLNLGIPQSEINTGNPSTGSGQLLFNKNSAEPRQAILRVDAPLEGTAWNVQGICPMVNQNTPVEVGQGDCNTIPTSYQQVFVDTNDVLSYVPSNGDIIYSDVGLLNPFDGGDNTYRMRVPTTPFPLLINWSFDIDANGVVSNATPCLQVDPPVPGGAICVLDSNEGNCESCWLIEVKVPQGETRQVLFESNFENNGDYGEAQLCLQASILVNNDGSVNISQNTFFTFAIAGQTTGVGQLQSEIIVQVLDGQNVEDLVSFTRDHGTSQCGGGQF